MRNGRKPSLRLALYGLVAAASLLPALVLAPWLVHKARALLFERAMLHQEMFHQQAELRLSTETERLFSVLENKADPIGRFLHAADGQDTIRMLLSRIMKREEMVTSVSLLDAHGRLLRRKVRADHVPPMMKIDDAAFVIPMHGRSFLGAPSRLADGHVEFQMSVPVYASLKVAGVLTASVRVDALWHRVSTLLHGGDARIYLVDSRGTLLAALASGVHSKGDLLTSNALVRSLLAGHDWRRHQQYRGVEGDAVFGIATLIPELKWGIISEVPARAVLRPIAADLAVLAAVVVALHILFGLLALMITRRLLRPFSTLMDSVEKVGKGKYSIQQASYAFHEMDALAGAFHDMVDEISRREESLRKLSLAMEQAAESVLITDREGNIEYVNRAFTRLTGYAPEEALGRKPSILKSGKQNDALYHELWRTITDGRVWEGRLTDKRKDGSLYPVLMTISPVREGDEITHFIAIQQDISAQDELEAQLRQAQKMESLGALVGGIAHDFNNSLAAISGNLYLMQQKAQAHPELMERIGKVLTLVESSARMIAQLLTFARKDVVSMGEVDLNALVRETMEMVRSTVPSTIRLSLQAGEGALLVEGDTTQIRQMLINLVVNARDAVADVQHPEIRLSLDACIPDATLRQRYHLQDRLHARLRVYDNGCGMNEETRGKIFDPFFTTKGVGEGSGLGLSMVFGAIERHQGAIEVESEADGGSCFSLWFPMADSGGGVDAATKSGPNVSAVSEQGRTLLLVDDNPEVLGALREILEAMGYRILEAADGAAGLRQFYAHADSISLVITDAVMPEMTGAEMLRAIRRQHREMPAIFITGYDPDSLNDVQRLENVYVLAKPLDFNMLGGLVEQLLGGGRITT